MSQARRYEMAMAACAVGLLAAIGAAGAEPQQAQLGAAEPWTGGIETSARELFGLADLNDDGKISRQEALSTGNLLVGGFFFEVDQDENGVITPAEARQARQALVEERPALGFLLQQVQAQPGAPLRELAGALDTNDNQRLELAEARQAVRSSVDRLFAMADENRDDALTPAELGAMAASMASKAADAAFDLADTDNNGRVSAAEFERLFARQARAAAFERLDENDDQQLSPQELDAAGESLGIFLGIR